MKGGVWITLICILVASSCTVGDPRTQAAKEISLEISGYRFHPQKWIVPAGVGIQFSVTNPEMNQHTLVILNKQGLPDLDPTIPVNQYWTAQVMGAEAWLFFQSPAMPGEYRLVCTEKDHEQNGEQGTLVVVIPEP